MPVIDTTVSDVNSYVYAPSSAEVVLNAYSRLQIRGTALLAEHIYTAKNEFNFMLAEWSSAGPNLWSVDALTIPLVPGVTTYPVDPTTIATLDIYVTGTGQADRILMPISRSEWASYPNKTMPGFPSVYWFDRLIHPYLTIWPAPYPWLCGQIVIYRWCQNKTADTANGASLDIPYRFLDAAAAGLSYRLSRHFAPQLEQIRGMDSDKAWMRASTQDSEKVPLFISPMTSSYYRT